MNKNILLILCCILSFNVYGQQKRVKEAARLIDNSTNVEDARNLINQALADSSTMNQAYTYLIAAKIEKEAYDIDFNKLSINFNDTKVDKTKMSKSLLNAYKYYIKALQLDTTIDKKGKSRTKYSKEIVKTLSTYHDDFLKAGSMLLNNKKYFPDAYEALTIYADLPEKPFMKSTKLAITDSVRSKAYYKAGLAAYIGQKYFESASSFATARQNGMKSEEVFANEIACYQMIAKENPDLIDFAANKIYQISHDAYKIFGITPDRYINNVINTLIINQKYDDAINILNKEIKENPETAFLYGLRAFAFDHMGNDINAEKDYRYAANLVTADFETLKRASKKLTIIGTQKYDNIIGSSNDANTQRLKLKNNYFIEALKIAQKAVEIKPDDAELLNIIEVINFNLQTHF